MDPDTEKTSRQSEARRPAVPKVRLLEMEKVPPMRFAENGYAKRENESFGRQSFSRIDLF